MVSCLVSFPFCFASQGNLCCVSQVITACHKVVNQDERSTSFVRRFSPLYMSGPDSIAFNKMFRVIAKVLNSSLSNE